jgi:GNAT superfamily N-acetyltransferase
LDIQNLIRSDINNITPLQPSDWNDIRKVFNQFIEHPFFYPVKISYKNEIIALGEAILNKQTGWIGNIIVHPNHRGKRLGAKLTQHFVDHLRSKGKQSQFLLATEIGKSMYEKLDFQHISQYIFLKNAGNSNKKISDPSFVQPFQSKYMNQVFALDLQASGEDRSDILSHFLKEAKLYLKGNQLEAFYLPLLGDGLIIAKSPEAGLALTKIRMKDEKNIITVPEQNVSLINWAKSNGFIAYRRAYKMYIGMPSDWRPEMIYSRIGGYLG